MAKQKKPVADRLLPLREGFGHRVETAARVLGDYETAAKAMGLGYDQLRKIMDEAAVPSFPAIAGLASQSGYRFEWLAFAEEPAKTDLRSKSPLPGLQPVDFVWVPELDARAAAGTGLANLERPDIKSYYPIPLAWVKSMGIDPARLWIMRAEGTSMEPDIRDGDYMVIYSGEETLRDGDIYVLSVGDDDTIVKQVQLEPDGSLQLISKNPAFTPRLVLAEAREGLNFAGRLVITMKRFG